MRAWFATIGVGVLLFGSPASGDVVHLTNGRRIEGKVVDERRGAVHLEVPGGRVVLPAASVERIERRDTPQDEYGQRARRTDLSDPDAVDALAAWAGGRGLGDQAEDLRALAQGLRLERKVAAVRGSRRAQDWVDVYQWSRGAGASLEVQRWLVEQASALDPDHPAVRAAARAVEFDAAMASPVGGAPEQDASGPRGQYDESPGGRSGDPARPASGLRRTHHTVGQAPSPAPRRREAARPQPADDARVAALEAELAQRDLEEQALRERLAQAEQQQQRRRRVRRRGPGVVLPLPCPPAPPAEPPPPTVHVVGRVRR